MEELKWKGFIVRKYYSKEEINKLVNNHCISLTYGQKEIVEQWVGRPKGMLQLFWERGWINVDELKKYSTDGKMYKKNEFGKVKQEYERYVLSTLMSRCLGFAGEQSAMEYLLCKLSKKAGDLDF